MADYYVSLSGSDTNDGSLATPFRNIQRAANVMIAGDTCWIRAGIYYEQVQSMADGLIGYEITFRRYANEVVVIDGQQSRSWGFRITHNYNVIDGVTIIEAAIDCVLIVGNDTKGSSEHNTVRNCILRDWGFAGGPYEMYAAAAVRSRWGGSYTTVENCIITRRRYPLSGNEEAAIHFWKTYGGHVVHNNYIDGRRADGSFGLYDGIGGGSPDMAANGGLFENSQVHHNVIIGCADDAIEAEGRSAGIQIHDNIIDSAGGRTGIGLAPVTVGPVTIYRNLIINHVDVAFKLASNQAISGGTIRIYNNTVVNHPILLNLEGLAPNALATSGGTLQVRNVTCVNNIFWARRYIIESLTATDDIWLDYCAVFSKDRGRDGILIGGTFFGPIKWHSTQYSYPGWLNVVKSDNQQIHGFYGEALFANQQIVYAEGDTFDNIIATQQPFALSSGSPCVDSGNILSGITDGFGGLAPDMGYLESPYIGSPRAQFSVNPVIGDAPLTVTITDMTLGSITEEIWDFGDGTSETIQTTHGTFTHNYAVPGTYIIMLSVSGPGGTSVASPVTVTVTRPVTLIVQTTVGGNTNPAPGTYTYTAGNTVTISATANGGYFFKQWLVNGQIFGENPITVQLDNDATVRAEFQLVSFTPTSNTGIIAAIAALAAVVFLRRR